MKDSIDLVHLLCCCFLIIQGSSVSSFNFQCTHSHPLLFALLSNVSLSEHAVQFASYFPLLAVFLLCASLREIVGTIFFLNSLEFFGVFARVSFRFVLSSHLCSNLIKADTFCPEAKSKASTSTYIKFTGRVKISQ